MAVVSLEDAIKAIAQLYDVDKDGKLCYRELTTYLLAILGPEWGIPSRPQKNNALLTAIGEDVVEVTEGMRKNKRGSVKLDAIVGWTITTGSTDQEKANLQQGLARHGYAPTAPDATTYNVGKSTIEEHTFDGLLRARLRGKKITDANQATGLTMDITNAMIDFKIAPAQDIQEQLGEVNRWKHMKGVWEEDSLAAQITLVDSATKRFTPPAAELVRGLFAAADANHDGKLDSLELSGMWLALLDSFKYPTELDVHVKSGGGATFEQLEGFYCSGKQESSVRALKGFLIRNGVDQHLKTPAAGWPAMSVDAYFITKLKDPKDQSSAMHKLKQSLHSFSPSKAIREVLATIPTAASLVVACSYFEALNNNTPPPPITSVDDALLHLTTAFDALAWQIVPQGINRQETPESAAVALADKNLESWVKANAGSLEAALDKLFASVAPAASLPEPLPSIIRRAGISPPEPNAFPNPLWRTFRAVQPVWLANFVLTVHARDKGASFPYEILVGACKIGGAAVVAALESRVSPAMSDWLKAFANQTPLPDVLPSDAAIVEMSDVECQTLLSSYLAMPLPQLAMHFAQHSITRGPSDLVSTTIIQDCKTIVKQLKVPGGRHALAAKLAAFVELGAYQFSDQMAAARGMEPAAPGSVRAKAEETIRLAQEKHAAVIKKELGIDPADKAAVLAYPLRVYCCGTMGHHPDAFHPNVGMQSYYLTGDRVGGSSDCMLVNMNMLKPEEREAFSLQGMEKMLVDRLNAPKPAAWESNPAVVYFSDMAPYLIRVACCFESPGMRYRVDPAKLYSLMKGVCIQSS